MNLRVGRAKQAFAHGAKTWLGVGPRFLGAFVAGQERLEVDAFELPSAIYDHDLRQTAVSTHAFAQNHHARAVAGRIEGEVDGQQPPGKGVDEKGRPGTTQIPPGARANELDVQLGVVDVADLERPIPMPGCGELQFPVEGLLLVRSPAPLALFGLLLARTVVDCLAEGLVARGHDATLLAGTQQCTIHLTLGLLLQRLVVVGDELLQRCQRAFRQLPLAVATLPPTRKKSDVATAERLLRFPPSGQPMAKGACRYRAVSGGVTGQTRGQDRVATIGLSKVLRARPGKQFLHLSAEALLPFPWAGQLALPDQGLERGMGQLDHTPILCQQSHAALPHVDDRPASSIPKDRCTDGHVHGPQLTGWCLPCRFSDHGVGAGRLFIAKDSHLFRLSQGGSANIHVEMLAGDQRVDLVAAGPVSRSQQLVQRNAGPGRHQ